MEKYYILISHLIITYFNAIVPINPNVVVLTTHMVVYSKYNHL